MSGTGRSIDSHHKSSSYRRRLSIVCIFSYECEQSANCTVVFVIFFFSANSNHRIISIIAFRCFVVFVSRVWYCVCRYVSSPLNFYQTEQHYLNQIQMAHSLQLPMFDIFIGGSFGLSFICLQTFSFYVHKLFICNYIC